MFYVVVHLHPFGEEVAKAQAPETADAPIYLRLSVVGNSAYQQSFVASFKPGKRYIYSLGLLTSD